MPWNRQRIGETQKGEMMDQDAVWVAYVAVTDTDCYAAGADVTITVHRSREGAIAAIREAVKEVTPDPMDDGVPFTGTETALEALGANTGEAPNLAFGEFSESDHQFIWVWSIYPRVVQP